MDSRRLKAANLHDEILERAADLFGRRGYDSVSMREISEACGVSKPALYYHFASKEAIGKALVDEVYDSLNSVMDDFAKNPPAETIEAMILIVDSFRRLADRRPLLLLFVMRSSMGGDEDILVNYIDQQNKVVQQKLTALLFAYEQAGKLQTGSTRLLVLNLFGVLLSSFVARMRGVIKTYDDAFVRAICANLIFGVSSDPMERAKFKDCDSVFASALSSWECGK
ncbi:MAG: TetR/AcrR family transcriptional regulator [Candidatus Brocadiia bacterium]